MDEFDISRKHTLLIIFLALLVGGAYIGYEYTRYESTETEKKNAYDELYDSLNVSFLEDRIFEYGANLTPMDLVTSSSGTVTSFGSVNTYSLGNQKIVYTVTDTEQVYGQTAIKTFTTDITIQDTRYPTVSFGTGEISVDEGSDLDIYANINEVSDPVDGPLPLADAAVACEYAVSSDLDLNTPGNYSVTVDASDCSGNHTSSSYSVIVNEVKKVEETTVVSVPNVAVSTAGNYEAIYAYLTGTMGLNKAAACGVLANIYAESSFNPMAGTVYFGLCQWGGGRLGNLQNWCAVNGYEYTSLEGQLGFMYQELQTGYTGVLSVLQSTEDSEAGAANAATVFCQSYEAAAGLGNRAIYAVNYYRQ